MCWHRFKKKIYMQHILWCYGKWRLFSFDQVKFILGMRNYYQDISTKSGLYHTNQYCANKINSQIIQNLGMFKHHLVILLLYILINYWKLIKIGIGAVACSFFVYHILDLNTEFLIGLDIPFKDKSFNSVVIRFLKYTTEKEESKPWD